MTETNDVPWKVPVLFVLCFAGVVFIFVTVCAIMKYKKSCCRRQTYLSDNHGIEASVDACIENYNVMGSVSVNDRSQPNSQIGNIVECKTNENADLAGTQNMDRGYTDIASYTYS